MNVVYTEPALADLEEIAAWLSEHYPGLGRTVEHIHHASRRPWDEEE